MVTVVVVLGALFAASLIVNKATIGTIILALVLGALVPPMAARMASSSGAAWLSMAMVAGYLAKLVASSGRYWVLMNLYHGVGDATGYHAKGLRAADVWRSFTIPELGTGTDFLPPATGLLYVPYKPTMLGGFFIFATLAFLGQLMMLMGFRYVASDRQFKWYAAGILFLPTILYWPSSIGKEALMFLFIGVFAYGSARLLAEYRIRWGVPVVIGLAGAAAVRVHVALLLVSALVFSVAVAKAPSVPARSAKRLLMLGMAGAVLVAAVVATSARFGLDFSEGLSADALTEEIDPFLADLSERTDTGGSAVEGGVISSPAEIPEATLRVLVRPLPWESTNVQTLAASVEGGVLLALVIYRLPAVLMGLRHLRRRSYALFSLVFTAGFIYAFSAIVNLGILARQRSQVLPFLLAFLVAMGVRDEEKKEQRPQSTPGKMPVPVG